jgi:hypothetical protein
MTEAPIGGMARYNRPYYAQRDAEMRRQIEKDPLPYIAKCEVCEWQIECEDLDMAEMAAGNHYDYSLPLSKYEGPVHTVKYGLKSEVLK